MSQADTLLPGNYPLTMVRGEAFGPINISCKNGLGAAFDLTGYTVEASAIPEIGSPNKIDLSASVVAPATGGIVRLGELTDEQTAVLLRPFSDGQWIYAVVLTNNAGNKLERTLQGPFIIQSSPTGT